MNPLFVFNVMINNYYCPAKSYHIWLNPLLGNESKSQWYRALDQLAPAIVIHNLSLRN